jgi:hypothetical protein
MGTVNELFSDRSRRSLGLEPVGVVESRKGAVA